MFKRIWIGLLLPILAATALYADENSAEQEANSQAATVEAVEAAEKIEENTVASVINNAMEPVNEFLKSTIFYSIDTGYVYERDGEPILGSNGQPEAIQFPVVVIWLFGAGLFFTLFMGFINFRGFKQAFRIVKGDYDSPNDPGEITHFQALTAAVSGTVGLGNIAGVALAISIGGPGAVFWMILAGLFGMTTKFTECTLGVKYREINERGEVTGGPMMYLQKGLANRGWPKIGKVLAVFAALMCIGGAYGAGAMFQVNQSSTQFTNEIVALTGGSESFFAGKPWIFGVIFLSFVGLVIIGGIKKITHVTEKLVPFMAILYISASLVIIFSHFGDIPAAFGLIFDSAFSTEAGLGGVIGALIQGLRRATFSNEAGLGSASIAHAAVKTKEPVSEGLVALLEPFIDTVVICTITGLVIILTGSYGVEGLSGIALTSQAFGTFADWFPYLLTVAVILFAFSTSITWFYYGQRSFLYLFGDNAKADLAFKVSYLFVLFIGSALALGPVMDIADALLFAMGFPNVVGLFIMRHEVRDMLRDYLKRIDSGQIKTAKQMAAEKAAS